ncbi:predicted protein [Uncinocarpus reesii 1704]|uniref:N-acetyltransferase domain-containing protein n=1 Tax=Uncinocarpus reesii (strain UAMH 1704) TaxID=336963 RepID=C4JRZ4_UNCRE|nr:uncharacterized protein UREG_05233 [Uncinocarpus reesii 1704]EEP80391.1 predicted protein [Uncinocarpus reesii 1704]
MKRPTKLRELRLSPHSTSNSVLSRMPLLYSGGAGSRGTLQQWTGGDQVPGLLIPIAFLSSLRANLQICASDPDDIYSPSSPVSMISAPQKAKAAPRSARHPLSMEVPSDHATIPLVSESEHQHEKGDQSYEIDLSSAEPPITISHATTEEDTAAALELIADSVSQQRQMAAKAIILHPTVLATSILVFLTSVKLLYTGSLSDMILMMTVWVGFSVFALCLIKYMLRGYLDVIERVGNWPWLSETSVHGASHRRDEILVAKENGEVIAVLVLRIVKAMTSPDVPGARPRSSRRKSSARWTGIIRAWTVKRTHRLRGTGTRLLTDVVANCRLRTLDGPIFADDQANSAKLLPRMFNAVFEKQEKWARAFLEQIILAERGR